MNNYSRKIVILILCITSFSNVLSAQTKLLSWNIENIGKSNQEIAFIANTVRDLDIIAMQRMLPVIEAHKL